MKSVPLTVRRRVSITLVLAAKHSRKPLKVLLEVISRKLLVSEAALDDLDDLLGFVKPSARSFVGVPLMNVHSFMIPTWIYTGPFA